MRCLGWSSMVLALVATMAWADAPPTDAPAPSPSPGPGESGSGIEGRFEGAPRIDVVIVEPEPVATAGGGAMLALWVDPFVVIEWVRGDGTRIRVEGGGNPLNPPGERWTRSVRRGQVLLGSGPLARGAASALWDAVADASPDFWQGSDTAPDRLVLRYGATRRVAALPPQYPAIERVLALLAQGE